MINLSKNIVLFSLVTLFVLSTGGINIFIHHCACHNEEQISLFIEEDCSDCETEAHHECCAHDHSSSHEVDSEIHESCCTLHEECSNDQENHSLCNTTQRFYQITDDYVEASPEKIPQPVQLALFILTNLIANIEIKEAVPSSQYETGPPIGLQKDGLELIYFYSCLKIPTSFC